MASSSALALQLAAAIALLAAVFAPLLLRRRFASAAKAGPLEIYARLRLDPRHSLVLVRVGDQALLVGVGEGAMTKLADIPLDSVRQMAPPEERTSPFAELLTRTRSSKSELT